MNPIRCGLGRSVHVTLCAAVAALALSVPASAGIIASKSGSSGASFGNSGEPDVYSPFVSFYVLVADVYETSPVAVDDVIVYDLAGAELAAAAAHLTDGIDGALSWVGFTVGLDSFNHAYAGGIFFSEGPGAIPDLQGNTIGGIRLIATVTCLDGTYRENPCGFDDPFFNKIGLKYDYQILVSDTPFDVPEPASTALIGLGVLGVASRRRANLPR